MSQELKSKHQAQQTSASVVSEVKENQLIFQPSALVADAGRGGSASVLSGVKATQKHYVQSMYSLYTVSL